MAKIIITKDSRKKCDIIVGKGGVITNGGNKNIVVRIDDDDDKPCKFTRGLIMKVQAGGGEVDSEKDGD